MKNIISTDFHAHILPGADHGSDSLETSVKQLEIISSFGIETVVATPHFYPMRDNVEVFENRRKQCVNNLKNVWCEDFPDVLIGAEVLVCEGMERMEGLRKLAVCGTDCILLEMPMTKWNEALFDTVWEIQRLGLVPVMAHVDRYDVKAVEELLSIGVKAQLNPDAFQGFKMKRKSMKWLEEGRIVALGSDIHKANEESIKSYRAFIKATNSLGSFTDAVENSMRELLAGAETVASIQS